MATKNKTLSFVASKTRNEKGFFEALLKNYRQALKDNNITLSKADMKKLGSLVRDAGPRGKRFSKSADAKAIRRVLLKARCASGENWPSPEWAYEWFKLTFKGGKPVKVEFEKKFR